MIYAAINPGVVELPLADAYNASIKTQINGEFELQFSVPLKSAYADSLERDVLIRSDDPIYSGLSFRIYEIHNGLTVKTISAHLKAYDLRFSVVKPFLAVSIQDAVAKLNAGITNPLGYTFTTSIVDNRAFKFAKPMSAWALIGEMAKVYGFEVDYTEHTVNLLQELPAPALDFEIRYRENMSGYDVEFDDAQVYTSVLPYWQHSGGTITYGHVIDAPNIGWAPYKRIVTADFTKAFERQPTVANLDAAAAAYIQETGIGVPGAASVKVSNVIQKNTLMEQARLGAYVKIIGPDGGQYTKRIVSADYDPITKRFRSFDLGEPRKTIEGVVQQNTENVEELDNNKYSAAPVLLASSTSTTMVEINMEKGYVNENFHTFFITLRNRIYNLSTVMFARADIPTTAEGDYYNDDDFERDAMKAYHPMVPRIYGCLKVNLDTWKCKMQVTETNHEVRLYGLR